MRKKDVTDYNKVKEQEVMRCKYCGQEVSIYKKFYNIDTCLECHNKGKG